MQGIHQKGSKNFLPFSSVAYGSANDAVRTVKPSDKVEIFSEDGGVPAIPEWQLSRIIILFQAGDVFAMVNTS
jgi:hypothetical protein